MTDDIDRPAELSKLMSECTEAQVEAARRIGYLQGYEKGLGDSIKMWERLLSLAKMMKEAMIAYWDQHEEPSVDDGECRACEQKVCTNPDHPGYAT